ncbi:uncharacterized protein LOC18773270 [Prunus persica]|uniref:uncharacterized protein LOC18773270 n=1 Tax=Prunus persica TaxID=3760 RepID=UPI0009AB7459|nr:uncharacterized protein LOC18773270 [Prunus persica]
MSRKLDKSKWKVEGHRRSPRISALEACKAQPPTLLSITGTSTTSTSATATARNFSAQRMKRNLGNSEGPASRTRARKKRNLRPVQEVAATTPSSPSNQENQQVVRGKDLKPGVHAASTDQPSTESSLQLPEKRILELILDILQRRDTYEIFAEPVDPNEVEGYYEIIEEPMDFGTMRAKLHEGMYRNLEQFEHDAFLITENAMHFNSTATIFFRQARAIHELTKKVFHVLETYPEKFELEFSETRQRSGRRARGEAGRSASSSYPKIATNMKSLSMKIAEFSKAIPCSLSGSSNVRRCQVKTGCSGTIDAREHRNLSGTQDDRRSRSFEADPRCTYRPWTSYLDENESTGLTLSSNLKQLEHANQQDIGYTESLMLFVKDLGPTAQKIARKKLLGSFQLQKSQIPLASTFTQWAPSTLNDIFASSQSQNFQGNLHGHPSIKKSTGDSFHSWDADKRGKGSLGDEIGIQSGKVAVASSSDRQNSHGTFGGKIQSSEFHQNRRNEIQLDSYSLKTHAADNSCSVSGFKNIGSNSTPLILNQWKSVNRAQSLEPPQWKSVNQTQSLEPPSDSSQSNLLEPRLRNLGFSSFSRTKNKLSSFNSREDCDQTKAETSQVSKTDQARPPVRQFTFDLPYLRAQLGKINSSGQDRFLQKGSGAELILPDKNSHQRASTCTRHLEMRNQPHSDYQNQPSMDTQYTDLALQL